MKKLFVFLLLGVFMISLTSAFNWSDDTSVSYYKLDETSGTFEDIVGEHNLTNTGATYGGSDNGIIINAPFSTTSGDRLTSETSPSISGDFSISLWANRTGIGDSSNNVLIDVGSQPTSTGFGIWITGTSQDATGSNVTWRINDDFNHFSSNLTLTLNTWENIVMTYDGANVKMYKNGNLIITDAHTTDPNINATYVRMFSRESNIETYIGLLDEVGLWNRSLTGGEITELYNDGNALQHGEDFSVSQTSPANNHIVYETNVTDIILKCSVSITEEDEILGNVTVSHNSSGTFESFTTDISSQELNSTSFNKTISVGSSVENVLWNCGASTNETSTSTSANRTIKVSPIVFTLCNSTYTTPFLNISFKDESDISVINASIPTSTFVYYLGDGTVTKTYTLINNTNNFKYEFCATPNSTFTVNSLIQYKQGSAYPQRIFSQTGASLTSTTTDLTLYLLGVSDGLFVTFQVFGGQSNALEGVSVGATRTLEGSDQSVAQGTTDAAGTVTFWLNPDFLHRFTYVKSGFETVIESLFPTQTLYTITMGGSETQGINDTAEGVVITTLPQGSFLDMNTLYTFAYIINSTSLDLDEFGFELFYNNGTSIYSDTSTASAGGTLSKSFNTSNETRLSMNYYYITDGERINGTTYWIIYEDSGFSIYNLLTRVGTYITADIFGVLGDDGGYFAKAMLSIVVLILVTGSLSMRYGLSSEAAVTGLLFGVVFMLNVFNLIPTPDFLNFIELGDFLVFLVALVGVVTIVKEETR